MPLSLHAAFVPSALQIVRSTVGLLDKAESWCGERECDESVLIRAQIHEDMFPLPFQLKSVAVHTAGAIEGVRQGLFQPDFGEQPQTFADARALFDRTIETLESVTEEEMEGWIGKPVTFKLRDFTLPFTGDQFLLSFSQPNYAFHAATAYDIFRMKGVPLGKRDFLGQMRLAQG